MQNEVEGIYPRIVGFRIQEEAITHYAQEINATTNDEALLLLSQSVAASLVQSGFDVSIVVRSGLSPVIGVLGFFGDHDELHFVQQALELNNACTHLRYVSYSQAEEDCLQLATSLRERFGREELKRFRFMPIPRGGYIVLGLLLYMLGFKESVKNNCESTSRPVVVVDDCSLTGYRFGKFIENWENTEIVFAHLYSHPQLRASIEQTELQVLSCVSARDITDIGGVLLGDSYKEWQNHWSEHLQGKRYWVGKKEYLCFAWNEPSSYLWCPNSERAIPRWKILTNRYCSKNPLMNDKSRLQWYGLGGSGIRPSPRVVFGEFGQALIVGHIETGENFVLLDTAAEMWRMLSKYGSLSATLDGLLNIYEVDYSRLCAELNDFVEDLISRDFLTIID